jgi:hypothetical protein
MAEAYIDKTGVALRFVVLRQASRPHWQQRLAALAIGATVGVAIGMIVKLKGAQK